MSHGLRIVNNGQRYQANLLDGIRPVVQAVLEDWYFGAPTQGNVLNASVGNFALTGKELTALKADRLIAPNVTSFALALKDLTGLFLGKTITTTVGNFTLTGINLTALKASRIISGTVQIYTLTPKNLTALLAARLLSPQPATFTLTGIDTGLIYAPKMYYILEPTPGTFVLTFIDLPALDYSGASTVGPIIKTKPAHSISIARTRPRIFRVMQDSVRAREEREEIVIL